MKASETWELVEEKMIELRIITEAKWRNSEWELAALGERVLRTTDQCKSDAKALRDEAEYLHNSIEDLKKEQEFRNIFRTGDAIN